MMLENSSQFVYRFTDSTGGFTLDSRVFTAGTHIVTDNTEAFVEAFTAILFYLLSDLKQI
jgi:hypothetical protein